MVDALPAQLVSLEEFLTEATLLLPEDQTEQLSAEDPSGLDSVYFVLTGRNPLHPRNPRKGVDVYLDSLRFEDVERIVSVARDFDSLIGVSENLPYVEPLEIWPNPRLTDALAKDNHLTRVFETGVGPFRVSHFAVPNVGFGGLNNSSNQHIVRLCFPDLIDFTRPRAKATPLTDEQMALIYNRCTRPAVYAVAPAEVSHWPVSYSAESWRSTTKHNGRSTTSIAIDPEKLEDFTAMFLELVRSLPFGREAYFLHEFRGTKQATRHSSWGYTDGARRKLEVLLHPLKHTLIENEAVIAGGGDWYVDIGLEVNGNETAISRDDVEGVDREVGVDHVFQWSRQSHHLLLMSAFSCSLEEAQGILRGAEIDLVAHLRDVAGFRRSLPQTTREAWGAHYINCYTTDKNPTYLKDKGAVAKYTSCDEFVRRLRERHPYTYPPKLVKIFLECGEEGLGCNARFEVRMNLNRALTDIWRFNDETLSRTILDLSTLHWWLWRSYRCSAIANLLQWQRAFPAKDYARPESIILTAVLIWALNALNNRPRDCTNTKPLGDYASTRVLYNNPEFPDIPQSLPDDFCGAFMFRDIVLPDANSNRPVCPQLPRLPQTVSFPTAAVLFAFNVSKTLVNMHQLATHICGKSPQDYDDNEGPMSNKMKKTISAILPYGEEIRVNNEGDNPGLPQRMAILSVIRVPNHPLIVNPDTQDLPNDEGMATALVRTFPAANDLERDLAHIWHQFVTDILQKAPASEGKSYLRLQNKTRTRPSPDVFTTLDLSLIFHKASVYSNLEDKWGLNKDLFFPPTGSVDSNNKQRHSWESMSYLTLWSTLVNRLDGPGLRDVLRAIHNQLDCFVWLPYASRDRVWMTRRDKCFFSEHRVLYPPTTASSCAPWLILNPKFSQRDVKWTLADGQIPPDGFGYNPVRRGESEE